MRKKDYLNAILLALSLEQPYRLLHLFKEVSESRPEGDQSITGSENVDKILAELSIENIEKVLKYIRDWNTNAKHSDVAQTVLNAILMSRSAEEIVEIPSAKEVRKHINVYKETNVLFFRSLMVCYRIRIDTINV